MRNELYSAIDLHSNNAYLAIIDADRRVVHQEKLKNKLELILERLEPHRDRLVSVAVESTYNWYWLADGLIEAGYEVELVNTAAVKQYEGLKHTNDRSDAIHLADLKRLGILPTGFIMPHELRAVRDLARKRMQLVQFRTGLILSSRNIQERSLGVRMSTYELKTSEVESVAAMAINPNVAMALGTTQEVILTLGDQIRKIEAQLLSECEMVDQWKQLNTIWGIGKVLSTVIMLETGPIERFKSAGNYASYCRCVRAERFSNGRKKGENNRRNGNRYLGWAYIEAAQFMVVHYRVAKRWYDRKLARVHKPVIARKALAHKIARAAYYVVREGTEFRPELVFR